VCAPATDVGAINRSTSLPKLAKAPSPAHSQASKGRTTGRPWRYPKRPVTAAGCAAYRSAKSGRSAGFCFTRMFVLGYFLTLPGARGFMRVPPKRGLEIDNNRARQSNR